jgi:hypothetical protein
MLLPPYVPSQNELEALFIKDQNFEKLAAYLSRFNPIRTMRMQDMEIRHTTVLAWLLDPKETHGLGDRFLRSLLAEAFTGRSVMGAPTALDVFGSDLSNASVRREWRNMDIFVLDVDNNWAFIIENKYYSRQRKGQLAEYVRKVKEVFDPKGGQLLIRGIFLTLLEEEPEDPSYAPLRYGDVFEIVSNIIRRHGQSISAEVKQFLEHYLEIIGDATSMNKERNEMEKLARELYRKHRKVLDFVFENGATTDFAIAGELVFGETRQKGERVRIQDEEFVYYDHTNRDFSFLPSSWVDGLKLGTQSWRGCEGWWAGYPLICWFRMYEGKDGKKGTLTLYAEVGPLTDFELRKTLIMKIAEAAKQHQLNNLRFSPGATDEGKQFSRFFKSNSASIEDVHDAQEIANEMKRLLDKFQPEFAVVANLLSSFSASANEAAVRTI